MGDRLTIRCRLDGPLVLELRPDPGGPSPGERAAGSGAVGSGESSGADPVFQVIDHEGRAFPLPTHKRAVALCRCGQSRTRPFCDGSHKETGFVARETAGSEPPEADGDFRGTGRQA
jgi:CDGSH-type Zn-finger protein